MRGAGGEALPASQAVSDAPTVPGLQGGVSPVPKPDAPLVCCNCGARLAADSAFCDMCGEPVRAQRPAQAEGRTQVISPEAGSVQGAGQVTWVPAPPAPPRGRLKVRETAAELLLPPGETEVLIGREDPLSGIHPDIDLTDHCGDEGGVSRQHARIVIRGCQFIIEDLNSTNGTFVNRERVTFGQQRPLYDGDEIRLGRVIVTFCVD
ncbi:MAG: FHA domain-containing protein [Anaerolineae bacterium]